MNNWLISDNQDLIYDAQSNAAVDYNL